MTIEEIFSNLKAHMETGINFHCELFSAFNFLNLCGYSQMHRSHALEEKINLLNLDSYYIRFYHKFITPKTADAYASPIPSSWYKYAQSAVDTKTRETAIHDLISAWVDWETQTKQLYQTSYAELVSLNEIAAANFINTYINDVSAELQFAEQLLLSLNSINYDMSVIVPEQETLRAQYESVEHHLI